MPTNLSPEATSSLLRLLQLTSPALPVGAFSYSEGIEALIESGVLKTASDLQTWLHQDLRYGAIRIEAAVMMRGMQAYLQGDRVTLQSWNHWLSATRETTELRQQTWQMGRALVRLLQDLQPPLDLSDLDPCNFAIAFGVAAAHWQIDPQAALLGYLSSWASNLISAGVRLIPLGQTVGQQMLLDLHPYLVQAAQAIATLEDDDLVSCGWGLSLASMAHETQYSRLFRS